MGRCTAESIRLLGIAALCLAAAAGCKPGPEAGKFQRTKDLLLSADADERAKGAEQAATITERRYASELVPILIEMLDPAKEKNPWAGIFAANALEVIAQQDFGEQRRSAERWRKWWYDEAKRRLPKREEAGKRFLEETRADYTNKQGELFLAGNSPVKALNLFREAISLDGRKARYHCNLGLALLALGEDEAAEMRFNDSIAVDKEYILAYLNKGKVYAERARKFREAGEHVEGVVRGLVAAGQPEKAEEARKKLAEVREKAAREEERALETYRYAIALDKGDELWSAHAELGRAYMGRGDFENALKPLERARALRRNDLAVRRDLALTYYGLDQYYSAQQEIKAIGELGGRMDPDFVKKVDEKVDAMLKESGGA